MRRLRLFEEFTVNEAGAAVVYHGTDDDHDFNDRGRLFNGTFFSASANEAKRYGSHLYKLDLKPGLNLLDTNTMEDCRRIIDEFGPLVDPYFDEGEEGHLVETTDELYHHSDSWSPIEADESLMDWIEGNYDGVWVYEGGQRNLLLFNPVAEKIDKKFKVS